MIEMSQGAEDGRPAEKTPKGWQEYWDAEMEASNKRFRTFLKQGNKINERFLDERKGRDTTAYGDTSHRGQTGARLNLFHTNVTTMLSMLYGQTPNIEVSREHQDPDDDVARVASNIFQRMLDVDVRDSGEDLSTVFRACLQDRLLPGLGVARVRYSFGTTKVTALNPETGKPQEMDALTHEDAPIDYVHWQDVRWGWCRTWKEMPWIAFRSYLTKDEATNRFGKKKAQALDYKNQLPAGADERDQSDSSEKRNNVQKAEIWEIWSKKDQRTFWWSKGTPIILDSQQDPLKLDGFWPMPKPLMANVTTTMMIPTADFVMAQDLYNQIDELYARITVITRAIKVVGVYDQSAGGSVGRMLKEGVENDLIPVDNWAMFAEKGGLKGTIDWFPVETVVATLQTLRQVLGETIELLYQVTGMSDILRGANTDQYTSDGTNQLKAKFGSIRIQALQDEFARFCSDLEALKAEVIAKHFNQASIVQQSGAKFLPKADQMYIEPALQLMKSPEVKWRVDIRPESIAMVDYAQLKSERTEFLTSMATYIQSAQAMVQAVPESLPILMEMLKWGMVGFKGSNYLEGMMDQAIDMAKKTPPQGQDDGKNQETQAKIQIEEMKQQTAQMKIQGDLQKIQAKSQADMQSLQAKLQGEIAKIQTDAQRDMALEDQQSQYALLEIARELEASLTEIRAQTESALLIEEAQGEVDMAVNNQEHRHKIAELRAAPRGGSNGNPTQ